jgi:hypothetical protein
LSGKNRAAEPATDNDYVELRFAQTNTLSGIWTWAIIRLAIHRPNSEDIGRL